MEFRIVKLRRDPECPLCGDDPTIEELIDYEAFCGGAFGHTNEKTRRRWTARSRIRRQDAVPSENDEPLTSADWDTTAINVRVTSVLQKVTGGQKIVEGDGVDGRRAALEPGQEVPWLQGAGLCGGPTASLREHLPERRRHPLHGRRGYGNQVRGLTRRTSRPGRRLGNPGTRGTK